MLKPRPVANSLCIVFAQAAGLMSNNAFVADSETTDAALHETGASSTNAEQNFLALPIFLLIFGVPRFPAVFGILLARLVSPDFLHFPPEISIVLLGPIAPVPSPFIPAGSVFRAIGFTNIKHFTSA